MKPTFKVNITPNKSRTYMFPFVHEQVGFRFFELLLNTYLSYEDGDSIFCVLYDWRSDKDFLAYEGEIMSHHLFIGHEDYGDKVLFKFELSRMMEIGRKLFIEGKYEEFSVSHKESIMKYLNEISAGNAGRISQILTKGMSLSSMAPNMDNEILRKHVRELGYLPETFKQ